MNTGFLYSGVSAKPLWVSSVCHEKRSSLRFAVREFHQIGFDEPVYFSVHHSVYVGCLIVGAMVFHAAVIEYVTAYLRAPLDFFLASLYLCLFFHAVLQFFVVQNRAQLAHGVLCIDNASVRPILPC